MPIQAAGARGVKGRIEILPEYEEGLLDLDGFSHIFLLYQFHLNNSFDLQVVPFLDTKTHGVFATRAPKRPNSIGLSLVKLTSIKKNMLFVEDVDMVNKTPIIDIKPYIPDFDEMENVKTGWYRKELADLKKTRSDDRFGK